MVRHEEEYRDNQSDRVPLARWRHPMFKQNTDSPSIVLSLPLVIDVSSLSLRLFRSALSRGKFALPPAARFSILVLDIMVTAGVHLYLKRDKPERHPLPMGSGVDHAIEGTRVRKWDDNNRVEEYHRPLPIQESQGRRP